MSKHPLLTALFILTISSPAFAGQIADTLIKADYPPPSGSSPCAVSTPLFNTWKKQPAAPNTVNFLPANSANFSSPLGDCSFYQWGAQMFLWLTSPEPGGNYVFLGKQFANVIGFDADGNPIFASNDTSSPNNIKSPKVFNLRTAKGVLKKSAEIPFTGEAGTNNVAMAQGGSLVYYGMHVNDVYVALQNNQKNVTYFQNLQNFPVSATQVTDIATASKTSFPDAQALTMELKTAWIDASKIPGPTQSTMLTIQGSVPNFVASGADKLVWDGKTYVTKTLALVGMHLVGSVKGHPEMIWATFEHFLNAPNNTFAFTVSKGMNITVPYNQNARNMTFFAPGTSLSNANPTILSASSAKDGTVTITSSTGKISPVSSVRLNPWGNVQNNAPAVISNNTQLVNLALSLEKNLGPAGAQGLLRAAYIQSGAVWTVGGVIPTAQPGTEKGQPNLAGSPVLANTTMETFFQTFNKNADNKNPKHVPPGCFGCHFANPPAAKQLVQGVGVSHLFNDQLPPAPTSVSGKSQKPGKK